MVAHIIWIGIFMKIEDCEGWGFCYILANMVCTIENEMATVPKWNVRVIARETDCNVSIQCAIPFTGQRTLVGILWNI